jgi:hypothetical protein
VSRNAVNKQCILLVHINHSLRVFLTYSNLSLFIVFFTLCLLVIDYLAVVKHGHKLIELNYIVE